MTGDELKAWREASQLTQAQAAERFGKSRLTWIRYEQGDSPVPKEIEIRLPMVDLAQMDAAVPFEEEPEPSAVAADAWTSDRLHKVFKEVLKRYPLSNTVWGASSSWDTRKPNPGWQRVEGCCRVVREAIPDPLPFYGPSWAGTDGVPTKSGEVYRAITGMRMRDIRTNVRQDLRPAYGSRLKADKKGKSE